MGETGYSRHDPGLDGTGKTATVPNESWGILGGDWGDLPDSRSGLIMGDFVIRSVPLRPLSHREMLCSYPHLLFSTENFPSRSDNRRVLRFRVQSSLGCDGEKTGSLAPFSNDFSGKF